MNHRIIALLLLTGCATAPAPQHADKAMIPSGASRLQIIACQADLNRDGAINLSDVGILASQVGLTCFELEPNTPCADLAFDGRVNLSDIPLFSEAFNGSVQPSVALCDNPSLGDTDGLSVWGEQVAKLNSNPEVNDTDGDGIDDLHELDAFIAPCKVAKWVTPSYQATIAWDIPLTDVYGLPITQSDVAGYKVYFGNSPGVYSGSDIVAGTTSTKSGLTRHVTYYFAASTLRVWAGHDPVEGLKTGEVCVVVP